MSTGRLDVLAGDVRGHEAFARLLLDHQQADAAVLVLVAGADVGEHQVGAPGEGGELLGAVDDVVVAFAAGRGLDVGGVRAGLGLGARGARLVRAAGHARQPARLLRGRAEGFEDVAAQPVALHDAAHGQVRPAQLLGHQAHGHRVQPQAFVVRAYAHGEEAGVAHLLQQRLGEAGVVHVHVAGERRDLLLREAVRHLLDGPLLLGQVPVDHLLGPIEFGLTVMLLLSRTKRCGDGFS